MGLRFSPKLAQLPSAYVLRQIVTSSRLGRVQIRAGAIRSPSRHGSTVSSWQQNQLQERKASRVRRIDGTSESVNTSSRELGLRMSFNAGVPLLDANLDGRSTFRELRHQANVTSDRTHGTLLVDQAEHQRNAKLWIEILHFRQRLDGLEGILDVWDGMRGRDVDLPVEGDDADILWTAFINAGFTKDETVKNRLLSDLFRYAEDLKARHNIFYPHLYRKIVGRWFRLSPKVAKFWHSKLTAADLAPPATSALKAIFNDVIRNGEEDLDEGHSSKMRREREKAFRVIYRKNSDMQLYDHCMDMVLAKCDDDMALKWHRMFMGCGDGPSTSMFMRTDVQHLFALDGDASLPMKQKHKPLLPPESTLDNAKTDVAMAYHPMTRAHMSTLVGDVHGIKPKEISDAFVAKMFATRAFSLDLVMRGLSFFGVDQLGPLAVREMATRAGTLTEFRNKLEDLEKMEIRLKTNVFCLLVREISSQGNPDLWNALLQSDLHPEAYDDAHLQEALLTSFLKQEKWRETHVALLALSTHPRNDASAYTLASIGMQRRAALATAPASRALNRLLQHYLLNSDWSQVTRTMELLMSQKVPLTSTTLAYLWRYLLPERRPSLRPIESQRTDRPPFDTLDFAVNAYIYGDKMDPRVVKPRFWVEMLKRYGMVHRWDGLEKLCLWIAKRYGPERSEGEYRQGTSHTGVPLARRVVQARPNAAQQEIFDRRLQEAVFVWGFRSAGVRNQLRPPTGDAASGQALHEPWAQGLALLRRLDDEYAIHIHMRELRRAFVTRMWILFGPYQSNLAINEMLRRNNQLTLLHYIRHANAIWGGKLLPLDFKLPSSDDERLMSTNHPPEDKETNMALISKFFGRRRSTSRKRKEDADVDAWADALAARGMERDTRDKAERRRSWERGYLRLTSLRSHGHSRRNIRSPASTFIQVEDISGS